MARRAEERIWKFDEYSAVDERILIKLINFELSVFNLYNGVRFNTLVI
ncbi:hypothetical protein [Parafilimonas sp.]